MSALEHRYRRLLALYPADHRSQHEREMLDVLMSAARPGQTRPSVADAADLLYGGLRIRLRHARAGATGSAWPGALAVAGFLATLMLLADGVRFAVNVPQTAMVVAERAGDGEPLPRMLVLYFGTAPYWVVWAAVAFLVWRGLRRPAVSAAGAATAVQIALTVYGTGFPRLAWAENAPSLGGVPLALAVLATASLAASPGPRHGARLLGRGRVAAAGVLAAAAVPLTSSPLFTLLYQGDLGALKFEDGLFSFAQTWNEVQLAAVLVIAVLVVAGLSRSCHGRRAVVLLAFAGAPLLVRVGVFRITASDDYPLAPFGMLVVGLVGVALAMGCVRLFELLAGERPSDRAHTPPHAAG